MVIHPTDIFGFEPTVLGQYSSRLLWIVVVSCRYERGSDPNLSCLPCSQRLAFLVHHHRLGIRLKLPYSVVRNDLIGVGDSEHSFSENH